MSAQYDPAARRAALDQLRFKKVRKQNNSSTSLGSSSASSQPGASQTLPTLPAQSRDATVPSRYFAAPPASPGHVLVPNSSPPPSDHLYRSNPPPWPLESSTEDIPGLAPLARHDVAGWPGRSDPLSAASFAASANASHASSTRPTAGNGRSIADVDGAGDAEPPRKRINRGPSSPPDPIDLLSTPGSPEVQLPGRRKLDGITVIAVSSDESSPEAKNSVAGSSKPRIVRSVQSPNAIRPTTSETSMSEAEDTRFTRFKMTQPLHPLQNVQAAWQAAGGDVRKASDLLSDPSWRPRSTPAPPPSHVAKPSTATGRVKEVDEGAKAQKAAIREKGKNSLIYKNRVVSDGKIPAPSTPTPSTSASSRQPAASPTSPEFLAPRTKRLKRKVFDSGSEDDYADSDDEPSRPKRAKDEPTNEDRALDYYNSSTAPALQELTGCTPVQAQKIIELRPFSSVDDLRAKLGQGKKKAGPAGISPKMFDDSAAIFEGYGRVDSILENCEEIGATLRTEIASWQGDSKDKLKETVSGSATPTNSEDGALTLHSQAVLAVKPKYYLTSQPSLLKDVQLKDYQMVGVNWLNLLYRRKYSCILADEMGLGKTVQVISFLAHLKEQGRKGPHLVVVPSSTLENWCREFQRFAPSINVETYYAGKGDRLMLRETLRETQASTHEGGWEVLITTYNLAQGDDKDRKFFRKIPWDACVFDEGHVLKNFQSQRYQALLKFESRWRLLLTGTPLQNNLQELVSLMNFILPQQFADDMDSLRAVFKAKGDSKVTLLARERVSRAKKMMTPFVLRRRKDQVLRDLPKKSERIEWCEMTPLQKSIYNDALRRSRKTVFEQTANGTVPEPPPAKPSKKTRGNVRGKDKMYAENSANVLMDLRKAALHPMLFRRRFTEEKVTGIARLLMKEPDLVDKGSEFKYVKEDLMIMSDAEIQEYCAKYKSLQKYRLEEDCWLHAGKMKVLLKLLRQYKDEGRRVLIFSQFVQVLDILQKVLDHENIKFTVLTGSTPVDARQALVDEFTEDQSIEVFLLSTKAGGMGINLTAASVVIMFDQDFNPHNDKQAQDRAYRIGQRRDVDVVKMITRGSIEENILSLGQTKLALDEAVAGDEADDQVEGEMKTSLMSVVRQKLEAHEDEDIPEEKGPVDADPLSPLSALDES